MVTAPAYPTFDLVSEEPWTRTSRRQAVAMGGPVGPVGSLSMDAREVRRYEVTITRAQHVEMVRLRELWAQTRFGALPMRYVHPEDGEVFVVFADTRLLWRQLNGASAHVTVLLEEAFGA